MVWNMAPSDLELIKVLFSYKNINLKLLWMIHSYTKIRAQVRSLMNKLSKIVFPETFLKIKVYKNKVDSRLNSFTFSLPP